MNTEKTVIKILTELSGNEKIRPEDALQQDIGLDSLGMVALLIKLEGELSIELKESDMNPFDLITVADVVALAEKYTGGNYEKNC